ncbi:hypothetical protein EON82_16685 [bacterium]|nr:MAG: hypothetical protein EON82_16685 [bacterium]
MTLSRSFALLTIGGLLCGCRSLSEEARTAARLLGQRTAIARSELNEAKDSLQRLTSGSDYGFYRRYAEREKWGEVLRQVEGEVSSVEAKVSSDIAKRVADNSPDSNEPILRLAAESNAILDRALVRLRLPRERASAIRQARDEGPKEVGLLATSVSDLENRTRPKFVQCDALAREFAWKAQDLAQRRAAMSSKLDGAKSALETARNQLSSKAPDYALVADSVAKARQTLKEGDVALEELSTRLDQLGRSYSKTLIDMRIDSYLTVGRSSWNEWSDYDTESVQTLGPVTVTPEIEEYLEKLGDGEIDEAEVRRLGVDPYQNMPSDHDRQEFWIEDFGSRYYHRYSVFENGAQTETEWVPVSEAYFDANEENLGMDVVTKPYGYYEDETSEIASPPGLSYVGNPRYGSWSGTYWHWHGPYVWFDSLYGGNRYSRQDYDYWNAGFRGRKPWYGTRQGASAEEEERYGSGSGRVMRYYGGSHWSRTGGFQRQDTSLRGAGSAFRAGGPGGGGK